MILTQLDVQQVEHDKTAEHLWPLDFISVEEGDIGCIPPRVARALHWLLLSAFAWRSNAIGSARRWKLSPAGGPGFFQAGKSLEIYSPFRRDEANGVSCYLVKLMKSNLFFPLEN